MFCKTCCKRFISTSLDDFRRSKKTRKRSSSLTISVFRSPRVRTAVISRSACRLPRTFHSQDLLVKKSSCSNQCERRSKVRLFSFSGCSKVISSDMLHCRVLIGEGKDGLSRLRQILLMEFGHSCCQSFSACVVTNHIVSR